MVIWVPTNRIRSELVRTSAHMSHCRTDACTCTAQCMLDVRRTSLRPPLPQPHARTQNATHNRSLRIWCRTDYWRGADGRERDGPVAGGG